MDVKNQLPYLIFQAIENELDLDRKLSRDEGFLFPLFRPLQKKKFKIWNFFVYWFFGWCILFISPFLVFVPMASRLRIDNHSKKTRELWFVNSNKADEIFKNKCNGDLVTKVGTSPYCNKEKIKASSISVYLKVLYVFLKNNISKPWTFYSLLVVPELTSFALFFADSKFEKVSMTNHYDRWAFLISHICSIKEQNLHLYQHGVLPVDWKPKYKLGNVYQIEVFDELSFQKFEKDIYFKVFRKDIVKPFLSIGEKQTSFTVLIIGSGRVSQVLVELDICKRLSEIDNLSIILRPHPVYYNSFKIHYETLSHDVVLSFESLPYANSIIHFGSTLAIEYMNTLPDILNFELNKCIDISQVVSRISEASNEYD